MDYAANCWIIGVESYKPFVHHVSIRRSHNIEASGGYFYDATMFGNGGGDECSYQFP